METDGLGQTKHGRTSISKAFPSISIFPFLAGNKKTISPFFWDRAEFLFKKNDLSK